MNSAQKMSNFCAPLASLNMEKTLLSVYTYRYRWKALSERYKLEYLLIGRR